jgi:hypothetical protein
VPGPELDLASYSDAFDEAYKQIVFWKIERRQTFREPGMPSWEAFAAGDWARALELNERERDTVLAKVAEDESLGVESRRLRVVEYPVTPYLQWEMQYFRLLAEAGEDLLYDAEGTAYGARRIDDPQVIAEAGREVADLYAAAEPVLDYFVREIAPLPAPIP